MSFLSRTKLMIITLDNLRVGLQWWLKEGKKRGWPGDMHNAEYHDMYTVRSAGPTGQWWAATVNRLWDWRAIRSPKPPNTKAEINARGQTRLSAIAAQHAKIMLNSATEPSITDVLWEEAAPLFALASEIKPGKSPVFASKMCHFLFPRLFVVMDTSATGTFEYEFYWRGMKDEWCRFKEKAEARNVLTGAVKSNEPILPSYPWETKIMELSHIGYNQR
jgi:hypothetical protein